MDNGRPPALPSICSASEIALIFADQLVLSFPDIFVGSFQSPSSGRTVEMIAMGPVLMEVLIGGLKACATVAVSMQSRPTLFSSELAAHVTLTFSKSTFPFGSPEQQFVAWLAAQPARSAFVDDAIMQTLIPTESGNPPGEFFNRAVHGLLSRKICETRTRKRWWVFSQSSLHLSDAAATELVPFKREFLARIAQQRAQLDAVERAAVRAAFDTAAFLRTAETTS